MADSDDDLGDYGDYGDDDPGEMDIFDPDEDEDKDEKDAFSQQWGQQQEGPQFVSTYKDRERTALGGVMGAKSKIDDIQRKISETPQEKFERILGTTSLKLIKDSVISQVQMNNAIESSKNVDVKYLNAVAYLLGYLANIRTIGRSEIESVRDVISDILPLVENLGVRAPDVVRYYKYIRDN